MKKTRKSAWPRVALAALAINCSHSGFVSNPHPNRRLIPGPKATRGAQKTQG